MSYKIKKGKTDNVANEPAAIYFTANNVAASFLNTLGGSRFSNTSEWDVLKLTRSGFPKHLLMLLAKKISLTLQEISDILHISERTLQRYEDDAVVKTEYAEKAIDLARLYDRGEEVFGSIDKFKMWMRTPSIIFKHQTPLSLLDTSVGFEMVLDELGRIEHGIFA